MSDRQRLTKATMGIREGLPLEASAGGVEGLRKDVQRLMDMEAIRQLKHAYFRCIDSANFEELATLFHEDVSVHFIAALMSGSSTAATITSMRFPNRSTPRRSDITTGITPRSRC